ncbi:MAG: Spy/CpxP family protein refolding chaperone [Planctomycetaceae bacterium]
MWAVLVFAFVGDPQLGAGQLTRRIERALVSNVEKELLRARRLTALSSEQSDSIAEAIRPDVVGFAKDIVLRFPIGPGNPEILPHALSIKIGEQIEDRVGGEARSKYQQDILLRRRLYRDAVVGLSVTMIDHRVNLTTNQQIEVRKLVARDWRLAEFCERSGLSEDLRPMQREGHTVPFGFPESSLLALLSRPQQAAWRFHQSRWQENPELFRPIDKPTTAKDVFVRMLQFHADILLEQLDLSDTQHRKLTLLAKKCGQKAHRLQSEAREFVAKKVPDKPTAEDLIVWEATYSADPELAKCRTEWQSVVLTVLSDAQRKEIVNRRKSQNRATHSAWAANQAHMLGRAYDWNGREAVDMATLFAKAPVATNGALTTSQRSAFGARIPKEKLSDTLTGAGLDSMKAWQEFIGKFHTNTELR